MVVISSPMRRGCRPCTPTDFQSDVKLIRNITGLLGGIALWKD